MVPEITNVTFQILEDPSPLGEAGRTEMTSRRRASPTSLRRTSEGDRMATLRGTLVYQDADSWDGYRVTAAWSEKVDAGEPVSRFRSAGADAKGGFVLELPEPAKLASGIDLAVNAFTGELVLHTQIEAPAGDVARSFPTSSFVARVVAKDPVPPGAGRRRLL